MLRTLQIVAFFLLYRKLRRQKNHEVILFYGEIHRKVRLFADTNLSVFRACLFYSVERNIFHRKERKTMIFFDREMISLHVDREGSISYYGERKDQCFFLPVLRL